ncbi:MAG TPA: GNAT family N-acetyltransferase [Acidimicrobiales bacterium]|nr:GNAT family N-acetyltransferase [Acidimicrobiales bacterium]
MSADPRLVELATREQQEAFLSFLVVDGAERIDVPGVVAIDSGTDFPLFNGVLHTDLGGDALAGAVESVGARFAASGRPWMWWHRPTASPEDLGARLQALSFTAAGSQPVMVRHGGEPPPAPVVDDLEIRAVTDVAGLDVLLSVLGPAFGLPPVAMEFFRAAFLAVGFGGDAPGRHFVGRIAGEPVGSASVLFHDGIAGIYNIGAVESVRRRGVGAAMTAAAITAGLATGVDVCSLQSSEAGYRVYEALGFSEVCRFDMYVPPGHG